MKRVLFWFQKLVVESTSRLFFVDIFHFTILQNLLELKTFFIII